MPPLLTLGAALGVAFLAGHVCARFSIPRVTGYLLAGILLGPCVLARFEALPGALRILALDRTVVDGLQGIRDLAAALILFAIGLGFRADRVRRLGRSVFALSATEILLTAILVFLLAAAASALTGAADLGLAAVLATVAVATAPAATMLVLREMESEGTTTDHITTLVGLDNVASLLFFALAFGLLYLHGPQHALGALGLGAAVGVGSGIALSVALFRIGTEKAFLVLGVSAVVGSYGLARWIGGDPLLACLALGATLANGSPHADSVAERIRKFDYPVYVIFFVLAGADLHLGLLLGHVSIEGAGSATILALVAAYVAGRAAGKLLSAPLALRLFGARVRVGPKTGLALLAQAGLAIALVEAAQHAAETDPSIAPVAAILQAVVLASVAVFELAGPPAVRYAVVHAGEVKIVNLLPDRVREGLRASLVDTLERLRESLGIPRPGGPRDAESILAVHIMRRHFTPIRAEAHFEEVVHTFAGAACDQYPVVDRDGAFVGVISFREIRSILFDDSLEDLVVAADLITGPGVICEPRTTLPEIIRIFDECQGEFSHLPVVDGGAGGQVVGIVDQRSAMVWFRQHGGRRGRRGR